jgi:TRAP-type mannitol/chloroaromatic compound transport system permease small subunit
MLKLLPAILSVLWFSVAYADEAEQPMETSTTGVVIFVIACVVCVVWFGWYMWKNEKKSVEEKKDDKF